MDIASDTIVNIYSALQDEESRDLFKSRLLYSVTGDNNYINDLVVKARYNYPYDELNAIYRKKCKQLSAILQEAVVNYIDGIHTKKKIAICGRGYYAQLLLSRCAIESKHDVVFFDKNPLLGHTYTELSPHTADIYIITSYRYYPEIRDILLKKGVDYKKIIFLDMRSPLDLARDIYGIEFYYDEYCETNTDMYFDNGIMIPYKNKLEYFIDVGFYDGTSSRNFIKWCNGGYEKIIAFEPGVGFNKYQNDISRLELHCACAWNKDGDIDCVAGVWGNAQQSNDYVYKGLKIDTVIGDSIPTFIKMDVEGNELMALQGAANTISKYHPRLAISIYHKPSDIIELSAYVLALFPMYKLYIRHYNLNSAETVLYALSE